METPNARPMVSLRGVDKHFGDLHVLRSIDLDVAPREVVVVVGPSGSGKSTLCRSINRLETIDGGEIRVDGELLPQEGAGLARLRAEVGMVFQSFNLFAHRTVLDNVALAPVKVRKVKKADAERQALELLDRVGIADKAGSHPAQLSGGQQQRAAIVRAIATDPEVLLLDEITSALDPELVGEVLELVRALAADGTTILMATHEMAFARDVADRVVFLDDGVIVEEGTAASVFAAPQHPRTQAFLSRFSG